MLALHALRQCFGEVCPELFSRGDILRYAETGKPYVGVGSGMYVSISHSHGLCAAAVSDSEVGVDIEYIDPNRPVERLKRLAKRFFSADELAYIKAEADAGDAVLPERFFEGLVREGELCQIHRRRSVRTWRLLDIRSAGRDNAAAGFRRKRQ